MNRGSSRAAGRIIDHNSEIPLHFFTEIQVKTLATPNNFISNFYCNIDQLDKVTIAGIVDGAGVEITPETNETVTSYAASLL